MDTLEKGKLTRYIKGNSDVKPMFKLNLCFLFVAFIAFQKIPTFDFLRSDQTLQREKEENVKNLGACVSKKKKKP